jgi:uncharacterized DUF497 family protein
LELQSITWIGLEGSLTTLKAEAVPVFDDPSASSGLKFEWDPAKNRSKIRKHGFDFADAEEIFRGLLLGYGEERWLGVGMIRGRVVLVAFVERPSKTIRIISLRRADHEERKQYEKALQDGLEAN